MPKPSKKIAALNSKVKAFLATQAFTIADIEEEVCISIPQGWYVDMEAGKLLQHQDPKHRDCDHEGVSCVSKRSSLYDLMRALVRNME